VNGRIIGVSSIPVSLAIPAFRAAVMRAALTPT
jgi:hypothetical protein